MQDNTSTIHGNWFIAGKISDTAMVRPDLSPYIFIPHKLESDSTGNKPNDTPTEKFITLTVTQKTPINPHPLLLQRHEWQVGLLVLSLLILTLTKLTRISFVKSLQKGITSQPMFKQLLRDGLPYSSQSQIPVFMVHVIIISIIIYQINQWYHVYQFKNTTRQLLDFLFIFAAVLSFMTLKTLSIKLSGFVFKTHQKTNEYISNSFLFNTVAALLFIPLLLFSVYVPTDFVIVVIIILAAILFIFRIIRGLKISMDIHSYSFYQKIMYFCALEILPVIWIVKALTG